MIRHVLARLVICALVILPGCALRGGPSAPQSPEGRIAQAGRQVIAAAQNVLYSVDKLGEANVLSAQEVITVATALKRVDTEGQRLSDVLRIVRAARTETAHQQGLMQAAAILKEIQRLVLEAGAGIGSDAGRKQIAALLGEISDAVVSLALLLPAPAV